MGGGVIQARRRSTRQDSLLWVLAIAAEHGMPLAPAVAGVRRTVLGPGVQADHGSGRPLERGDHASRGARAVARAWSRATRYLLAWVGQASGKLPRALRLAATTRSTQLPIWTAIAARLSYILGVLLVMQTITSFILYFIMPSLKRSSKTSACHFPRSPSGSSTCHIFIKYGYITFVFLLIELGLLVFLPFSFLSWGNYTIPALRQAAGPEAYGACVSFAGAHGRRGQADRRWP